MAKNEFEAKLTKLRNKWKSAQSEIPSSGDFPKLDPGRYVGRISDGEVNESKTTGRLQCFMELTVTEGESKGDTIRKYYGLDKEESLTYLQRDLVRLGIEIPEDPEELENILQSIVKQKLLVKFRVKENGEYLNIYLDKLVSEGSETEHEVDEVKDGADMDKPAASNGNAKSVSENEDDESTEIEPGLRVNVTGKGAGIVKEVDEDEGNVTVKLDIGKTVVVGVDKLSLPSQVEEEPVPTPVKTGMRVSRK